MIKALLFIAGALCAVWAICYVVVDVYGLEPKQETVIQVIREGEYECAFIKGHPRGATCTRISK